MEPVMFSFKGTIPNYVRFDMNNKPYYVDEYNQRVDINESDIFYNSHTRKLYVFANNEFIEFYVPETKREDRIKKMEEELSGKTFQEIAEYVVDNYVGDFK